jgi:hypothetical protein
MKVQNFIDTAEKLNFSIFTNDAKPYNLNLWFVRNPDRLANSFNDKLYVFWNHIGWNIRTFNVTMDPGTIVRLKPSNPLGVAIVKAPQQPARMWSIGLHQGKYEALVQRKAVTVIRDFNKDAILDFIPRDLSQCYFKVSRAADGSELIDYHLDGKLVWRENTGVFGINCHRANINGQSINVDNWSEGCQVFQNEQILNPDNQQKCYSFDYFMHLCNLAKDNWGNNFTPTFINESDLV